MDTNRLAQMEDVTRRDCRGGPRWFAPFIVVLLACLLSGALVWSDRAAASRGVVAMLTIAAWPETSSSSAPISS